MLSIPDLKEEKPMLSVSKDFDFEKDIPKAEMMADAYPSCKQVLERCVMQTVENIKEYAAKGECYAPICVSVKLEHNKKIKEFEAPVFSVIEIFEKYGGYKYQQKSSGGLFSLFDDDEKEKDCVYKNDDRYVLTWL